MVGRFSWVKKQVVRGWVVGLVVFVGVVSCQDNTKTSSDIKHNVDEPIRSSSAWQWHELSEKDVNDVYLPFQRQMTGDGKIAFLPANDPLSQRAQAWVDKIDQKVRADHPEEMQAVPKPVAVVHDTLAANAFVTPVPTCVSLSVELNPGIAEDRKVPSVFLSPDGFLYPAAKKPLCVQKKLSLEEGKQFVEWLNSELMSCSVTLSQTGSNGEEMRLIPDKGCTASFMLRFYHHAEQIIYMPAANRINVQAGIALIMEEEPFAAVIAHELAHYYRAHTVAAQVGGKYNFFYELEKNNPSHVPVGDPSLQSAGNALRMLDLPHLEYRRVEGQKIISELFKTMFALPQIIDAGQDCSEGKCNLACQEFTELVKTDAVKNALNGFPQRQLKVEEVKKYLTLENKAETCLANARVAAESATDGSALNFDVFVKALGLDLNVAVLFNGLEVDENADIFSTLLAAGQYLQTQFRSLEEPLKIAHEKHLGFYTAEQEADELGMEWISDIGIDPARAVDTEFAIGFQKQAIYKALGISEYPFTVDMERCAKLYKRGWIDDNGEYVFVPVADFADTHHSSCYRAYNLDREIAAHGFVANPKAEKFVPPTKHSWAKLQEEYALHALKKPMVPEKPLMTGWLRQDMQDFNGDENAMLRHAMPKGCSHFH